MTTTGQAEEMPLNFEREPQPVEAQTPGYHDVTVTLDHIGRKVFRIDGMLWDLFRRFRGLFSLAERGPDPDYDSRSYERGFTAGRRVVPPNIGGVNGNSKILTALVALNTALLIGVGGWVLATVARHDKELAVIACQLNPQACPQVNRGR
jgi:hypothetical protein